MAIVALHDLPAPAKLNLFLRVVDRRADGYHLLRSRMVCIDWCDTLHVERRDGGALSREDAGTSGIEVPADDLALRAARALQAASSTPLGAHIVLEKRIPTGAGLGGGSSDAATVLLALNRLWGLGWPLARLLPIGTALGADVPFFLGGRAADVAGIGERLTPVGLAAETVAVVKPRASLATAAVFGHPLVAARVAAARIAGFSAAGDTGAAGGGSVDASNDLQPAAEALEGEVGEASEVLRSAFGDARMTGSGSAVFASVGSSAGEAVLPPLPDGWRGRICRTLPLHPLAGWAEEAV